MFAAAGNAVRLNYVDFPNAPASDFLLPVDPDGVSSFGIIHRFLPNFVTVVTFLKFALAAVDVTWRAGNAALVLSLPCGVKVDSNDLGGLYYRKITSLRIPEIRIKVLLTPVLKNNRWLEAAEIVADVFLDIYASPLGYRDMAQAQLAYIEEQDRPTGRARRMFSSLRMTKSDASPRTLRYWLSCYIV